MLITLDINDKVHTVEASPETPLLWVLRDQIGLTGTKFGCGVALCGACTIHVDGQPTRSCIMPVSSVSGKKITTIEGLAASAAENPVIIAVEEAWQEEQVVQCGYCQSGQIMSATALLQQNKQPDDTAINDAMSGNICRCSTYPRIRQAVKSAAQKLA